MAKKRVLIVDDEQDIVEAIRFNLESENIECLETGDGWEALKMAREESPDLIILDIMLPSMDGYQISRLLKFDDKFKDSPIIMLTARAQKSEMERGKETGADEYLAKPFDMNVLVDLVKKYLAKD